MEIVKIKLGTSLFYYIYVIVCAGVFLGLYFGLRNRSEKTKNRVLFGVLAINFVLHFVKLAFPQYIRTGFPDVIRKCTFENICAVSTLIFPFIYLSNWKAGKDYMFYLGMISGVIGCVAPMPILGLEFYQLETMRYYICHASVWQVPLLMVIFGLHKLDYRRNWKSLVIYFGVLGVIIVNEIILIRIGWVETSTFDEFFSAEGRDMAYAVGFPHEMQKIANLFLWLTPEAWKNPCVPILWELFPVIVFGGLYTLFACAYWERGHIRQNILSLVNNIKEKRKARRGNLKDGDDSEQYGKDNNSF